MKLSKEQRASIVDKAISHAFDKREKAHEKARMKFADDLYTHHHGDAEKIAAKLPDEWQRYASDIGIQHPEFNHRTGNDSKGDAPLSLSKRRLSPNSIVWINVKHDHPFYDRATDLARAEVALKAERRELRIKLNTIVNAANTLKQLAEQWPAGAKFFPADSKPESRALVPANLINDVNKTLGITA